MEIAKQGGIPPLIALLQNGTSEDKTHAAGALLSLANNADNEVEIAKQGGIPPLIALLQNGTSEGKTQAAGALRNLACNADNKATIRDSLSSIEAVYNKETDTNVKKEKML